MYSQVWREWSKTYTRYVAASVENSKRAARKGALQGGHGVPRANRRAS
jgi:hypothetical protein